VYVPAFVESSASGMNYDGVAARCNANCAEQLFSFLQIRRCWVNQGFLRAEEWRFESQAALVDELPDIGTGHVVGDMGRRPGRQGHDFGASAAIGGEDEVLFEMAVRLSQEAYDPGVIGEKIDQPVTIGEMKIIFINK